LTMDILMLLQKKELRVYWYWPWTS
jgi:hypothetical protein